MKNKIMELTTKFTKFANQNSPSLLTGAGVAGVFVTAYMAYKAGPKAKKIIDDYNDYLSEPNLNKEVKREATKEFAKEIIPVVLPTIGMATATSAAIIGANSVSSKRIAVLSAAYSMSETALKEYQAKVAEILDEKKVKKIKEGIAQDKLKKQHVNAENAQDVIMTGTGDVLCMDAYSGRFFRSNAQKIGEAINHLSADLLVDMYVSLNDFYDLLGLKQVPLGDDFGWNMDDLDRGQLDIEVTACLTDDKQPCLVVDYNIFPREDYRRLH